MTKQIIEETNSAKKANTFLLQGSKSIIAIQREDGTITNSKTETSNLATNFYRSLYESKIEVETREHQASEPSSIEEISEDEVKMVKRLEARTV